MIDYANTLIHSRNKYSLDSSLSRTSLLSLFVGDGRENMIIIMKIVVAKQLELKLTVRW